MQRCDIPEMRFIDNFDNYFITSDGEVWTRNRRGSPQALNNYGWRKMPISFGRDGYGRIRIGGRLGVTFLIHRLVASHFLNKDTARVEVNHKDMNKANNDIKNLEYVTPKENMRHARHNIKTIGNHKHYIGNTSLKDIAKISGTPYQTLYWRFKNDKI